MDIRTAIAQQLRTARERNGMSQQAVAERLGQLGLSLHQTAIAKIEAGRRSVSVEELFALAIALNVAPVHVVVPFDAAEVIRLAPEHKGDHAGWVREWVRGAHPLPGQDARIYQTFVPDDEWRRDGASAVGASALIARAAELLEAGDLSPEDVAAAWEGATRALVDKKRRDDA